MASFEERSISSKIDSSDAETHEISSEKVQISIINVDNSASNADRLSELTMADHLSTMENVIVQNRVQLQSASNDSSDPSSGQTNCNSNPNHGHLAENIVSSTQETANDSFSVKSNSDSSCSAVNKCDVTNTKLQMPKSMATEKHINSEQSHVANVLSSQNRKAMDESKRHSHISDSSKSKQKSSDGDSTRSSQKKKKKDRERDRDREKDSAHRHKSHSSSKSTSDKSAISLNGKIVSHLSDNGINRSSAHDKTTGSDKCKLSSTKPTSSSQSNPEHNGKHLESASRELKTNDGGSAQKVNVVESQIDQAEELNNVPDSTTMVSALWRSH